MATQARSNINSEFQQQLYFQLYTNYSLNFHFPRKDILFISSFIFSLGLPALWLCLVHFGNHFFCVRECTAKACIASLHVKCLLFVTM